MYTIVLLVLPKVPEPIVHDERLQTRSAARGAYARAWRGGSRRAVTFTLRAGYAAERRVERGRGLADANLWMLSWLG